MNQTGLHSHTEDAFHNYQQTRYKAVNQSLFMKLFPG